MSFFRQFPKAEYVFTNEGIDRTITDFFRFVQADFGKVDDVSVYQSYQIQDGDRPDVVSNLLYGTPNYYWTFFLCNEQLKTGMKDWPLSSQQFELFIDNEYDGKVITTAPSLVYNSDRSEVIEYRDSLAGRFELDETVTGALSGATGTVFKRDAQLSQLVLKEVTGTFRGDGLSNREQIAGAESGDVVTTWKVYSWRDAPHHYLKADGTISYNALYIDEDGNDGFAGLVPNPSDVLDTNLTPVSNYEYELELNEQRSTIRVVRPEQIYAFAQRYSKLLNA